MSLFKSLVRILISCSLLGMLQNAVHAQVESLTDSTATPIPGVGHDYIGLFSETVDPQFGSLSLRIKTPTPPGRRLSMPFSFSYDSAGTLVTNTLGWETTGLPGGYITSGGWSYSLPMISEQTISYQISTGPHTFVTCKKTDDVIFYDTEGTRNSLLIAPARSGSGPSPCPQPSSTDRAVALPTLTVIYRSDVMKIATHDGIVYSAGPWSYDRLIPSIYRSIVPTIEDSNGNLVHVTDSSPANSVRLRAFTITDDIGRTLIASTGVGTNGDTVNISGLPIPYTINWATQNANFSTVWTKVIDVPGTGCRVPRTSVVSSFSAISAINLPNGTKYTFAYDQTYGQLSQITYPSGGYVKYHWGLSPAPQFQQTLDNDSQPHCAYIYNRPVILSRTVSYDGTNVALEQDFSYSRTTGNTYPLGPPSTAVTSHDYISGIVSTIVYTYTPGTTLGQETDTAVYQDASSNTLKSTSKTWINPYLISNESVTLDSGITSQTTYVYAQAPVSIRAGNPFQYLSEIQERDSYDFGQSSPSRKDVYTYQAFPTLPYFLIPTTYGSLSPIFDRFCSAVTSDGSGNRVSETDFFYDSAPTATVCGVSGTPSVSAVNSLIANTHDETNYSASSTAPRGNLTAIIKRCFPGCADQAVSFTYDATGHITAATDPRGNVTQYLHTDSYTDSVPSGNTNAFLTKIVHPTTSGVAHIESFSYAYSDSQVTVATDQNLLQTKYTYNDNLRRLTTTDFPDGGQTNFTYSDALYSPTITTSKRISSSQSVTSVTKMDGMGHTVQTQLTSDPQGTVYSDKTVDGSGHIWKQSNPHRSTSAPTDGTTTNYFDALGRICLVVPPDGTLPTGSGCPTTQPSNTIFTTYSGSNTTVTDQAGKARKSQTDAFGRLTSVWEDPSPGLNYLTTYQYDPLGNLISVVQNGSRQRTFNYNSLSELSTATNPESGTITYNYDNVGNLLTKIAPAPNQTGAATVTTTYAYDALNRLTQKSYSDSTAAVKYGYDAVSPAGCALPTLTIHNGIGKRTGMCDAAGAEAWSYDITAGVGWKTTDVRTTAAVTKTSAVQNNFDGSVAILTYPSGRVVNYTYNTAARPVSVIDPSGPINYATSASYSPPGGLTSVQNGASVISTSYYNQRLQPCRISVKSSGTAPGSCIDAANIGNVLDFTYNFSVGTADNGNVSGVTNNRDTTRSQAFTYNSLNRISTAKTTSTSGATCWDEAFVYDAWGNLLDIKRISGYTCSNEELLNITVTAKNQISGNTYDAAGNLNNIPSIATYAFNAENQLTSTAGITYTYDGDGKRVQKSSGKLYWYGTGSDTLEETDLTGATNNSGFKEYMFFAGQRIARRDSANAVNYYFADHLGTARIVSNSSGAILDDSDFYPFGGERVTSFSSGNRYKFTGKERDSESGLDNFGARYDSSSMGRFMSPDSTAYVKPINPQSWNLYAYALNNPLRYTDPTGHTVSLVSCQDKAKCVQILANAAQLPDGVTAEVDSNGNLVLKGDLSKIKGGNALRLEQLVNSDKIANFWIGTSAPTAGGGTQSIPGGTSGTTGQGFNQNFAMVNPNSANVDSGDLEHGVYLNPDGSIAHDGSISGATPEETAAHELLGHVWADVLGGEPAGTAGNKREALIAEDRVRNTDPDPAKRGLKIYHQREGTEYVYESDLPRITNPGSQP